MTLEEMEKEFEEKFVERGIAYYCWQTQNSEEVWNWFESKLKSEIAEACKKQREICADAFMTKEDYLYIKLNTPDTISTLKRDEILNAPSPLDKKVR